MDWVTLRNRAGEMVKKYKYVVLVLALGVFLMALPESNQEMEAITVEETDETVKSVSENLEEILMQIEGVGKVRVLLTEASGAETIYQSDEDSSQSSDSKSIRVETVIISNSDRNEQGLVKQVNPPVYLGAIVVCQGADRPSVQLGVVDAVSKVTGLSTDRITVMKMK